MKHLIAFSLIAAAAGSAQAVTLFNNGAAVSGSPALSVIRTGGTTFGIGAQGSVPNSVADNFTVGGAGWVVQDLSFFSYQTGAANVFTFTNVAWSVISGDVNTGTVVASGTTNVTNGGLLGYRVTSTTLTDTNRAIFQLNADVTDFNLAAGSYWLRWTMNGTLASGPWQPPLASGAVGNAQQALGAAGAYAQAIDGGDTLGYEIPFVINGTVNPIPEPSTYALMVAGGLAVVGLARRRRNTR
jgi:hypothetical protein